MASTTLPRQTTRLDPLARWAVAVYLGATAIGVLMRWGLAGAPLPLPFDHLLHAHSHALYFGWAALVILAASVPAGRARRWAWAGLALVPLMTVAFLLQGYGPVSIAGSTVVMWAWYGAIVLWWRSGNHRGFTASHIYIVLAGAGVLVLAPLQASGAGDSLAAGLAIHAFLSTFAWSLVLGSMTLVARHEAVDPATVRQAIAWLAALAWLLFPLGVIGGPEVPVLGWLARLAGLAVLVPIGIWATALWRSGGRNLRLAGLWLAAAGGGLAAVSAGGSAVLGWAGRAGIVFYLHALLLGHVTAILAWHIAKQSARDLARPLDWHHASVAVMMAGVLMPLGGWAVFGNQLAAVGAGAVWVAGWAWAIPLWRHS